MKKTLLNQGQNLAEIVLIIGVVSLVFISMEIYFKRGLNAKVKDLTDSMIGREHTAYQQDTSGLEINTSNTVSSFSSQASVTEGSAGQKSLKSKEDTNVVYSSQTADSTR